MLHFFFGKVSVGESWVSWVDEPCDDEDLAIDEELWELEEYNTVEDCSMPLSDTMTDEELTGSKTA